MTSQAAEEPETVAASRRSKITPEREQEFFDAVLDQVRSCGYDALTMEGVAATTRCSKSTLYRQWKTKPQFVAAALRANHCPKFIGIDTGSLAGDLRAVARTAGERSDEDTRLLQALGPSMTQDDELKRALREALVKPELDALGAMIGRAVERGEIAADLPVLEFLPAQLLGVLRVRPLLEGRPADADYLLRFVEVALLPALGLSEAPCTQAPSTG
ncbi:TetR/AcrR family transcriptional regulator C-terminal ligand-binding domain-containing protein [Streptomyces aurantiacus]|uniref:TetR family transcriptional regulator n=1 Tax=Streptomyces aurantiacus TaxID=47760 RepID=A0A7G1NUW0_9ACTN|nr:TetR/AcrR family transcriptional regulator [Streptomyces aurantiacus]BCL26352.1 TetR family transcriptional regulator [Streptomyces aurantiacus]